METAAGRVAERQLRASPLRPPDMEVVHELFAVQTITDAVLSLDDKGGKTPQLGNIAGLLYGLLGGLAAAPGDRRERKIRGGS